MSLLSIFKSAPHIAPIEDEKEVEQQFRYWRLRVFYSMYVGYAFFYVTRKSFAFAIPALKQELGYDTSQLGFVASMFALTYGFSKFTSGILADRSNPRYFMPAGLFVTGICNLFFGLNHSVAVFAMLWGVNGWFQGFGAPVCARLLTQWYSRSERGRWWGLWNTCHNASGVIIPIFITFSAQTFGWRYAFYLPGIFCILMSLFLVNRLRDTPQSLGLPDVDVYHGEASVKEDKAKADQLGVKEMLLKYVLKNSYIWLLCVAYFALYIVRTAISDWSSLYLVEQRGYSQIGAGSCVSWFEVGGFFGSLGSGWISDKIFKGRRGPVNALFMLMLIPVTLAFGLFVGSGSHFIVDASFICLLGFLVFGPQMLIGIAAAELSHKNAAATAVGFTGWFAYLGSAMAGYPLGYVINNYGWSHYFLALTVCAVVGTLALLPLWSARKAPKYLTT